MSEELEMANETDQQGKTANVSKMDERTEDEVVTEILLPKNDVTHNKKPSISIQNTRIKMEHFLLCLEFFFFQIFLLSLDVGTDIATAIDHFSGGDIYWGSCTLIPIFQPFVGKLVSILIGQGKNWLKPSYLLLHLQQLWWSGMANLPILQTLRNCRLLVGLITTDSSLPKNAILVSKMKMKALDNGFFQTFLQSAPQFILQSYIIVQTGKISYSQYLGMPISFMTVSVSSLMMFFTQRLGRYPDASPTLKMKAIIYPFIVAQMLGPMFSLVLLSLYYKEFIIICILIIVFINLASLWILFPASKFRKLYPESDKFTSKCTEDVHRIVFLSSLTSWITTSSVLSRNNTKRSDFLTVSSTLSMLCHFAALVSIFIFISFEDAMEISRYPFSHCFNQSIFDNNNSSGFYITNYSYFTETLLVAKQNEDVSHTPKFLRICGFEEESAHFFYLYLGPTAVGLIALSFLASVCLQKLSDYSCCVFLTTKCLHFTLLQDWIDEGHKWYINKFEAQINKGVINIADPLVGETFFHHWVKSCGSGGGTFDNLLEKMIVEDADPEIENINGQTPIFFMTKTQAENYRSRKSGGGDQRERVWNEPPMHSLAKQSDTWFAVLLLLGGQLFSKDSKGETALVKAFEGNPGKKSDFLLRLMHLNIDRESENIQASLFLAAEAGLTDLLHFLVESNVIRHTQNASIHMKNKLGLAAIHLAAIGNHKGCQKILLDHGASPKWREDIDTATIYILLCKGHQDVVKWLVKECGADVNLKDKSGLAPLHLASENGHLDVVKCLVKEGGADVNLRSENDQTPLHIAARSGHLDVVKCLVDELGADVNLKNKSNQTPLHLASQWGHLDVAKCLVTEAGLNCNVVNDDEQTPLHVASRFGHLEVAKFLVKDGGSDANLKDYMDETPLHLATRCGHLDLVKYLVKEAGAAVNLKNRQDDGPLHLAAKNGFIDVVKYLVLEGKAEVNMKRQDGQTPLHQASGSGHLDVVTWLVKDGGADVAVKTEDGQTPLHSASRKLTVGSGFHFEVVEWLVKNGGADVNLKNNLDQKPVDFTDDQKIRSFLENV